jgi:molybdopterin-guanine dinucleotide biosynthesis protein A
MGRDKALLPFRGRVLVEWVADAVAAAAGSAVLVGHPDVAAISAYPTIPDSYPGEGPLGGILTALRHSRADWNLITACDMPGLTAAFLARLLDHAGESGCDVLLPLGPAGRLEPLCGVYHRRALAAIEAAFASGDRKILAALAGLRTAPYRMMEFTPLENVNTPEDWAGYAAK